MASKEYVPASALERCGQSYNSFTRSPRVANMWWKEGRPVDDGMPHSIAIAEKTLPPASPPSAPTPLLSWSRSLFHRSTGCLLCLLAWRCSPRSESTPSSFFFLHISARHSHIRVSSPCVIERNGRWKANPRRPLASFSGSLPVCILLKGFSIGGRTVYWPWKYNSAAAVVRSCQVSLCRASIRYFHRSL